MYPHSLDYFVRYHGSYSQCNSRQYFHSSIGFIVSSLKVMRPDACTFLRILLLVLLFFTLRVYNFILFDHLAICGLVYLC